MTIVGENNTEIRVASEVQPVADSSGDFKIVSGDGSRISDLKHLLNRVNCFTKMKMEMKLMDLDLWISAMRKMMSLRRRK